MLLESRCGLMPLLRFLSWTPENVGGNNGDTKHPHLYTNQRQQVPGRGGSHAVTTVNSGCAYCTQDGCTSLICTRCLQSYGLFTRRHHCRVCGSSFCAECSPHRLRLPSLGFIHPVRLCGECHAALSLDKVWEQETLTIRRFLRMQDTGWHTVEPLSDAICRRLAPAKCLWRARSASQEVLVCLMRVGHEAPLLVSTNEEAEAVAHCLRSLRHPYLHPTLLAEYILDRQRLVVVRPLARRGSLRDRLHRADPLCAFPVKYQGGGRALPLAELARFGRQVGLNTDICPSEKLAN